MIDPLLLPPFPAGPMRDWWRSQDDIATAIDECPRTYWLLRLAECVLTPHEWVAYQRAIASPPPTRDEILADHRAVVAAHRSESAMAQHLRRCDATAVMRDRERATALRTALRNSAWMRERVAA